MISMKIKKRIKAKLTKNEYRSIVDKVIQYNQRHGKLPTYITYGDEKIYKNEYMEAIEYANKFILENGRNPEKVVIYEKKHNH